MRMTSPAARPFRRDTDVGAYFREQSARCLAIGHARRDECTQASTLALAPHWQTAAAAASMQDVAMSSDPDVFELALT
jgi:hypothetical protein